MPVYPPIDPNEEDVAAVVVEEAAFFRSRLVFVLFRLLGRKSLCGGFFFLSLFLLMVTFIILSRSIKKVVVDVTGPKYGEGWGGKGESLMELVLEVADWINGMHGFFNRVMRRLALEWLLYIRFDWKFGCRGSLWNRDGLYVRGIQGIRENYSYTPMGRGA